MNETPINNKLKASIWLAVASVALMIPAQILLNTGMKQLMKETN